MVQEARSCRPGAAELSTDSEGTPLVDVVLPVHRGRRWVEEAVDSVLAQTYRNLHLVVVDDACPERTLDLVEERYGHLAGIVTLVRLDRQRRPAGARMAALSHTRGSLLGFIDQDDRWHPEKLARQVEYLAHCPELTAVHTDIEYIDSNGCSIGGAAAENQYRRGIGYPHLNAPRLLEVCFERNSIRLVSALVRRQAFESAGGFDVTLFGGEDWEFWVRFAAHGYRIGHLEEPLVQRRFHSGNTSLVHRRDRQRGLDRALDAAVARNPDVTTYAHARRVSLLRSNVVTSLESGDTGIARTLAARLIRLDFRSPVSLALFGLSHLPGHPGGVVARTVVRRIPKRQRRPVEEKGSDGR